jgi:hypothetical protein
MSYFRRVVKRRPASLTGEEWLLVIERGKQPRPMLESLDARYFPPVDVYDLVLARELEQLRWRTEQLCMAMQEPTVPKKGEGSFTSSASRGELLSQFSELWAFLSGTTYASGKQRLTGSLSVSLASEGVKVTLMDPTSGTYCTRVGNSLDDVLMQLELGLADATLKFLPSNFAKPKK